MYHLEPRSIPTSASVRARILDARYLMRDVWSDEKSFNCFGNAGDIRSYGDIPLPVSSPGTHWFWRLCLEGCDIQRISSRPEFPGMHPMLLGELVAVFHLRYPPAALYAFMCCTGTGDPSGFGLQIQLVLSEVHDGLRMLEPIDAPADNDYS